MSLRRLIPIRIEPFHLYFVAALVVALVIVVLVAVVLVAHALIVGVTTPPVEDVQLPTLGDVR